MPVVNQRHFPLQPGTGPAVRLVNENATLIPHANRDQSRIGKRTRLPSALDQHLRLIKDVQVDPSGRVVQTFRMKL